MKSERRPFRRRVLEPLAVFFILGGVLLVARSWVGDRIVVAPDRADQAAGGDGDGQRSIIEIDSQAIAEIVRRHTNQTGRPPTAGELEHLIDAAVDEEIVVREALALGLHERDSVVRQRLVRNMRFLGEDARAESIEPTDDDALLRAALSLGMHRTDLVVRRRLAERMRLRAITTSDEAPLTREQREAFLEENAEQFRLPEQTGFTQVMIQRGAEHTAAGAEALALLERLVTEPVPPGESREVGLASLLPWHLEARSDQDIAQVFGAPFAQALPSVPVGRWSGPVASSFGLHAVYVHERRAARAAKLVDVDEAVRAALREQRRRLAYGEMVSRLRENHEVRVASYAGPVDTREPAALVTVERRSGPRKKQ